MEPVVDPAQDYVLIAGYENVTHTVMRFQRKLDTCDATYDIPISVSFLLLQSSQNARIWSPANVNGNEFKCNQEIVLYVAGGYCGSFKMLLSHQPKTFYMNRS